MISRRIFARAAALAPLAARRAGDLIHAGMKGAAVPESGLMGYGGEGQAGTGPSNPAGPRLPRHRAARLALRMPELRALAYESAWRSNRRVFQVDPDIEVNRSFSAMAKITFQRQRNVERMVHEIAEPDHHDMLQPLRDFLNKTIWGR